MPASRNDEKKPKQQMVFMFRFFKVKCKTRCPNCFIQNENALEEFWFPKNKSDRVQTSDAFWRSSCVFVSELSLYWYYSMFLILFCSNSVRISTRMWRMDVRTDGGTDRHTLLKRYENELKIGLVINWWIANPPPQVWGLTERNTHICIRASCQLATGMLL